MLADAGADGIERDERPARRLAIGRELTKVHETFWRGTVGEYLAAALPPPRGEVTVLVAGAPRRPGAASDEMDEPSEEAEADADLDQG